MCYSVVMGAIRNKAVLLDIGAFTDLYMYCL